MKKTQGMKQHNGNRTRLVLVTDTIRALTNIDLSHGDVMGGIIQSPTPCGGGTFVASCTGG